MSDISFHFQYSPGPSTTNVYINGLPLRYNDDDLYRLTRGFGAVKSVKMFTRHLEDKPSAYGFVL